VRIGQTATARLDGLPDEPYTGRVVAIDSKAQFTPRVALTEDERADLLFGVKITLPDAGGALKPGLPVTVRIDTTAAGSGASPPAANPATSLPTPAAQAAPTVSPPPRTVP
jgi:multidrug efflux pump subunit AcrA (membrane-fusion protein)